MRDYRLSLTLIALVMLGYTAMVLMNRKPSDGRVSASIKQTTLSYDSAPAPSETHEKD